MSDLRVLLVHGTTGSEPWHWQRWLAAQLRERDVQVDLPTLPVADGSALQRRITALRGYLDAVPEEAELVVLAHSCGAALWLHHAATRTPDTRRADRVLLVAPPESGWRRPESSDIAPYPAAATNLRAAAGITRLVAGTDDPHLSVRKAYALAESLRVELDVILEGAHLNTEAGYGPWPCVLRWALYGTVPLHDRYAEMTEGGAHGLRPRVTTG